MAFEAQKREVKASVTDVLFLLFVPSAALVVFIKLGVCEGGLPIADYLASFDQLHKRVDSLQEEDETFFSKQANA